MFAKDTLEDPANRIERDGFLDEIERISEATGVFDGDAFGGTRRLPRRARPRGGARARAPRALRAGSGRSRVRRSDRLADGMGVEAAYALLAFARQDPSTARPRPARGPAAPAEPDERPTSRSSSRAARDRRPKVKPKRLSTGQAPLEIARIGSAWRISCTGCGESSPPVQFRWQVLDQSVVCRCE